MHIEGIMGLSCFDCKYTHYFFTRTQNPLLFSRIIDCVVVAKIVVKVVKVKMVKMNFGFGHLAHYI